MTDILVPPTPLDGQTYPSFPTQLYADVVPDRPFYVKPPAMQTPMPSPRPPDSGVALFPLSALGYSCGSPVFSRPAVNPPYVLGSPTFGLPTLIVK